MKKYNLDALLSRFRNNEHYCCNKDTERAFVEGDGVMYCADCMPIQGKHCPTCYNALAPVIGTETEEDWEMGIDESWSQWFFKCAECDYEYDVYDCALLDADEAQDE